jgi:hypothetical protein
VNVSFLRRAFLAKATASSKRPRPTNATPIRANIPYSASEVKELASQTARATEEIAGQVTAIQSATADRVLAIGGISDTIREISGVTLHEACNRQPQAPTKCRSTSQAPARPHPRQ